MKFVAMLTIVDPALNQEVRPAHLRYISDLYETGQVFAAGPFLDGKGGMVIYECEDAVEADRLAQADPVVACGARTVEVRPWQVLDLPLK